MTGAAGVGLVQHQQVGALMISASARDVSRVNIACVIVAQRAAMFNLFLLKHDLPALDPPCRYFKRLVHMQPRPTAEPDIIAHSWRAGNPGKHGTHG